MTNSTNTLLQEFIAENTASRKTRKLDRFASDIDELKSLGFTDNDVLRYLSEKHGFIVSKRTLSRFINRDKKAKSTLSETAQPAHQPQQPKSGVIQSQMGKFDAREKINVDEWK